MSATKEAFTRCRGSTGEGCLPGGGAGERLIEAAARQRRREAEEEEEREGIPVEETAA